MVAAALVDVYEATFDRRWLDEARGLAEDMVRLFWDERLEGFYDTGVDHERLIVRPRNLFDNAVPCGSSVAIETLFRLAILTGESRYEATAVRALRPMADLMARHASGFGRFLCALDFHLGPVVEIALLAPERATASRRSRPRCSAATCPTASSRARSRETRRVRRGFRCSRAARPSAASRPRTSAGTTRASCP